MQVHGQRLCVRPPNAYVVAGLSSTGEVEVDLHAELDAPAWSAARTGCRESVRRRPAGAGGRRSGEGRCSAPVLRSSCCRAAPAPAPGRDCPFPMRTQTSCSPGCGRVRSWWTARCLRNWRRWFRASSIAASRAVPVSMSRSASPMRTASAARTVRPVNATSAARPGPISRTRFHDVPSSPMDRPIRTKPALKLAVSSAIRMSAAKRQRQAAAGGGTADGSDHRVRQRAQPGRHRSGGLDEVGEFRHGHPGDERRPRRGRIRCRTPCLLRR